jgi:uncharacterized protein (TIGR02996 family)
VNWWERPDWAAWNRAVQARPADNLTRLQAADWLDEQGVESADRRAKQIRDAVALTEPPVVTRVLARWIVTSAEGTASGAAEAGFPELAWGGVREAWLDRGFVVGAMLDPGRFTKDPVARLFRRSALVWVELHGRRPRPRHRFVHGLDARVYSWDEGLGDEETGEVKRVREAGAAGWVGGGVPVLTAEEAERLARDGVDVIRHVYDFRPDLLPGPVFWSLPRLENNRETHVRTDWPDPRQAYAKACRAAWHCGRRWAGLTPVRGPMRIPIQRTHELELDALRLANPEPPVTP